MQMNSFGFSHAHSRLAYLLPIHLSPLSCLPARLAANERIHLKVLKNLKHVLALQLYEILLAYSWLQLLNV